MATRVLLADDHPVYREGLAGLIDVCDDMVVVGQASDGAAALALAEETRPDVAVLDLNMPGLHGIEAARAISRACPETAVLVLTMYDDDATIFQAVREGARGYVLRRSRRRRSSRPSGRRPTARSCSPRRSPGAWPTGSAASGSRRSRCRS